MLCPTLASPGGHWSQNSPSDVPGGERSALVQQALHIQDMKRSEALHFPGSSIWGGVFLFSFSILISLFHSGSMRKKALSKNEHMQVKCLLVSSMVSGDVWES